MAYRVWHGIWYGLASMAWYMLWLGGHDMVYAMAWWACMVYGIAQGAWQGIWYVLAVGQGIDQFFRYDICIDTK